jgi:putative salt-induced outer membrane protein YdiY
MLNKKKWPQAPRLILITVLTWYCHPLLAGQIVMLNGDIITGDVKTIWDKKLAVEPAYADTFEVDLDAVAYIESERVFDIEFADGRAAHAKMLGGNEGIQIIEIDGKVQEIPVMQLAELDEPEDYYDWDTFIDLNSTVEKGNTDSEKVALKVKTNLKLGDHRHLGELTFARETQSGETTKEQELATYAYNWSFNAPWFLGGNLGYESDPIKELEYRINVGGGVGYDIWDASGRFFQVQAVGGWQTEKIDQQNNDNAIGGWILRFRYDILGGDLNVFHNNSGFMAFSGRRNNVLKSETGVRYEITDLLYLNFEVDFDYESNPASGAEHEDLTMLLGIGVEL